MKKDVNQMYYSGTQSKCSFKTETPISEGVIFFNPFGTIIANTYRQIF